jgi:hypothetical protein
MKLNIFSKMYFKNAKECAKFLEMGEKYFIQVATTEEIHRLENGDWIRGNKTFRLENEDASL